MKTRTLSLAILLLGASAVALAGPADQHGGWDHEMGHGLSDQPSSPAQAPEMDPASIVAALTLLGGGLAVLRSRRSANSRN
ncbi:MAG: hypothetical protein ACLPV8_05215 [Steroidobacteraceae bacterium]